MQSQIDIFSKLVKDFMRNTPLAVAEGTPCSEVIERLATEKASGATVIDSEGRPVGIVTERDVARKIAFKISPETPVDEVMTTPVITILAKDYLYHSIGRMRRRGHRHMPVVNKKGLLVGILNLKDALTVASSQLVGQIDRLTHQGTLKGLKKVKAEQVQLAEELFESHLPAAEIQAVLTHINNDIYRRIIDATLRDMAAEGWGKPPVNFTTIVFGSGGRGENYLFPDQDNGFILEDYPDDDHNRIDSFFIELAERMTRDLDAVGLPYCNGYCMAVNPLWRKTLPQWIEQIDLWGRKRNFVAIRLSDIFFDFQPVWGNPALARKLRNKVAGMIKKNHFFLQQMFAEVKDHNVALGFFGGLVTEQEKKKYKGQINLKHTGTIPLVGTVRLLSLREGVKETSTLRRIEALNGKGVLDDTETELLSAAFELLTNTLLKNQIKAYKKDRKVNYYVDPDSLSKRKRERLTDALKDIDNFKKRVRAEFTAEIF
ncbi:MAG: CBS domain-containing protein [Rhodospirillales bacterium]|nr:CBS domain-containing protein [Rhodospirillales bacterium]